MGLEIKLTEHCNLRCSYCYYQGQEEARTMTWDKLKSVLDFFLRLPEIRKFKSAYPVTFFSGEPLICQGLIRQAVSYCRTLKDNNPFSFYINTNGTLFDPDFQSFLDSEGVKIILSLDGAASVHDRNRLTAAGSGSYQAIEPWLPWLAARNTPVEKVICANTVDETVGAVRHLTGAGFSLIISVPDFSADWTPDTLERLKNQYIELAAYYREQKNTGKPFIFSLFDDKIAIIKKGDSYRNHSCNIGKNHYVISPDGSIYPCTRFAVAKSHNPYRIGHTDSGLDQKTIRMMQKHTGQTKPPCKGCSIRKLCLGASCDCISYTLGDDISYVSPLVCEHERMLYDVIAKNLL